MVVVHDGALPLDGNFGLHLARSSAEDSSPTMEDGSTTLNTDTLPVLLK
jgi:hypothetical protein